MPLSYWHIIPKHLLPQLIQSPIIVVPHIPQGLPHFFADLQETTTIEKMQAQGFPLVLRQGFEHLIQAITPKDGFCGIIALRGRITDHMTGRALNLRARIEMPRGEVSTPLDCSLVGHMNDPGACRAFGTVEDRTLSLDEEKQILGEILGLCRVSEDTSGYAPHDSCITLE